MENGLSDHVWTIEELCGPLPQPISSTREMGKNFVLKALAQSLPYGQLISVDALILVSADSGPLLGALGSGGAHAMSGLG